MYLLVGQLWGPLSAHERSNLLQHFPSNRNETDVVTSDADVVRRVSRQTLRIQEFQVLTSVQYFSDASILQQEVTLAAG